MDHFLIFLRIISYTLGFTLLIFILNKYIKSKNRVVGSFFLLWLTMTLTSATYILELYLVINISHIGRLLGHPLMLIAISSISITLPNFVHNIFSIKRKYIITTFTVLSAVLIPLIILTNSTDYFWAVRKLVMLIIILSNIYSYIVSLHRIMLTDSGRKKNTGLVFMGIYLVLFVLLLILDIYGETGGKLFFFPLFYLFIGGFITFIGIKFLDINIEAKFLKESKFISNYNLTNREAEISRLVADGHTYKKIGELLYISVNTVKTHVKHIYEKTETSNKIELRKKLEQF